MKAMLPPVGKLPMGTLIVLSKRALAAMLAALALASSGVAASPEDPSRGQTLYIPVYSHIYSGDREEQTYLAVTVSIRNTDPSHPITLTVVDYYNSEGRRIQRYLDQPLVLAPMASTRYVVKESDKAGGSGANFLVRWESATPVSPPLTESVMISTVSQLGISFTSRGVPILVDEP